MALGVGLNVRELQVECVWGEIGVGVIVKGCVS